MSAGVPGRLLLASNNGGKLQEFAALLAPLGCEVIPQGTLQVPEAAEPFDTFLENALAKARHASALAGLPALADDSGLCVDALGGAPGVHSARYAGEPKSDARNNLALLHALRDCTDRTAHFACTLVLVMHPEDPDPLVAQGRWSGQIAGTPSGTHGFGYDPLFFIPELACTAAELGAERKNRLSHRARALAHLVAALQARHVAPLS